MSDPAGVPELERGKSLLEAMGGAFPGFPERLNQLKATGLGRGISLGDPISGGYGADSAQNELIGYILPLNTDNTRHIVLLRNGMMVVHEPIFSTGDGLNRYVTNHAPNDMDYLYSKSVFSDGGVFEQYLGRDPFSKVVLRGDKPEDVEQIQQALDTALEVARKQKEIEDQTLRNNAQTALGKINDFLTPR